MNRTLNYTVTVLCVAAVAIATAGCKRAENAGGSRSAMDAASSGVLSNSAAPNGTHNSDAANRANASAGSAASSVSPAGSEATVNQSPNAQPASSQ
ncbi:hypothetical protein [Paraburkholderia phytofirmans]|uniref:hypothetical protein n=1 Tax=Paraburkholderia phytofirmans TaxID=261302 RepID=UPI0038BE0820